jgi:ectoine hydroxylase-related dioxygenase (phytanoyl-CoA dioxygenase family)
VPLSGGQAESGGLWVAPGSHRLGPIEHSRGAEEAEAYAGLVATRVPQDSTPLDVSPGQVVVLHSEVLHRSLPNKTATGRLACQYGFVHESTRFLDSGLPGDYRLPLFRAPPEGAV